jgi:uncharacterized protein YebE (UPF0316 family)
MYLILALVKVFDNLIMVLKSITTYKGQKVLSSILVVISQLLFYLVIQQVVNDNTLIAIIVVSISSGIGNYVGFLINDRFKKDDTWTNILTTSNKEDITKLCTILKKKKIKYLLFNTFNRQFEESLTIMVFAKTRAESKLIDNYLEFTDAKYLRMIDGIEVKMKE